MNPTTDRHTASGHYHQAMQHAHTSPLIRTGQGDYERVTYPSDVPPFADGMVDRGAALVGGIVLMVMGFAIGVVVTLAVTWLMSS